MSSATVILDRKESDNRSADSIDTNLSTRYPITLAVARERALRTLRRSKYK